MIKKNYKNGMLSLGVFLCGMIPFTNAQAQLGISVGGNLSKMRYTNSFGDGGNVIELNSVLGLNGGLTYTFGEQKSTFKTGILFSQKGYATDFATINQKVYFNYLELPLHYVYTFPINETIGVQLEGGAYLAFLAGGNVRTNNQKERINFDNSSIRRSDAGLALGIGAKISKFHVGLQYDTGLLDISSSESSKYLNRTLGLHLTYFPFK